jgi:transposase
MGRQPHPIGLLEVPRTCELTWRFRQDVLVHGLSQRAACEKYKLGWHTLKKILAHAEPPGYRQRQARPRRVLAAVLPIIHEILEADQKAPRKQRHTAMRIFERLKAEYGYLGGKTLILRGSAFGEQATSS